MLVLSRRVRKSIRIGDEIKVTIVATDRRGTARIAIDAPRHVPIDREQMRQGERRRRREINYNR